jgi:hypothetical protein
MTYTIQSIGYRPSKQTTILLASHFCMRISAIVDARLCEDLRQIVSHPYGKAGK